MKRVKELLNELKKNYAEYWTLAMIFIGLPFVAFIYVDWRLALATFVLSSIAFGIAKLRSDI